MKRISVIVIRPLRGNLPYMAKDVFGGVLGWDPLAASRGLRILTIKRSKLFSFNVSSLMPDTLTLLSTLSAVPTLLLDFTLDLFLSQDYSMHAIHWSLF